MGEITVDLVSRLYLKHGPALARVRQEQRELLLRDTMMRAKLDDIEAEITYLLLRHTRPESVVEIGAYHGWSTTWMLNALRENDRGHLYSFDLGDDSLRHVPKELAGDRWTFTQGDVRRAMLDVVRDADYLFIDAGHGKRFASWYVENIFSGLSIGTMVSVHDVFHRSWAKPFGEGAVVLQWLAGRGIRFFTASRARAPGVHHRLAVLREELGLADPVRVGGRNPMIFFGVS